MKKTPAVIPLSVVTAGIFGISAFADNDAIDLGGEPNAPGGLWAWIIAGIVVLAVIVFLCIRGAKKKNVRVEESGAGVLSDKKHLRNCYKKTAGDGLSRCMAYIAFDSKSALERFSPESYNDIVEYGSNLLSGILDDNDYVASVGDGEFAVYFQYSDISRAKQKIEDIVDILNKYQKQKNNGQSVPFAGGLYAVKNKNENFDVVLADAKLGYNRAAEGEGGVCICTKEMIRNEYNRVSLKSKLSQAIDNDEFEAFIQFIYGIKDGRFIGGEVLSRWNNPIDGFLTPAYYINDMRVVGVIGKFDYYMLGKTCRILEKWKNTEFGELALSCNFTRITISEDDFIHKFGEIVNKYDFDHDKLILEITEDAFFDNSTTAYKNMVECKKMGFGVAIDDFGAGSSSVSDLSEYPIDIIKVDRQIIKKSTTKRGGALVDGISTLAHSLGIRVLCEGVETEEQDKVVKDGNSDYIQGYYYSYVFPLGESEDYFRKKTQLSGVAE